MNTGGERQAAPATNGIINAERRCQSRSGTPARDNVLEQFNENGERGKRRVSASAGHNHNTARIKIVNEQLRVTAYPE